VLQRVLFAKVGRITALCCHRGCCAGGWESGADPRESADDEQEAEQEAEQEGERRRR
jgi:hypothetical protein